MHGLLFPHHSFAGAPHSFNALRVCSSIGVHKIKGVIYCCMWHPCRLCNSAVGLPLVTVDYTTRTYVVLDEGEECGGVSVLHLHQEAFSCSSFCAAKHPVTFHDPASVELPFAELALIYFDFNSWPSNDSWVIYEILCTYVPHKIKPIYSCLSRNLLK